MRSNSFNNKVTNKQLTQKLYIYIYFVIHKQTVSLHHNSSMWLDTHDALSREQNPPKITPGWWHTPRKAGDSTTVRELTHMYPLSFVYIFAIRYRSAQFVRKSKEDELGMIQFENILEDSYKSPGVLNVWWLIYEFINFLQSKFI